MGEIITPKLAVDCLLFCIEPDGSKSSLVLIERKNEPKGFALPGGFVDIGETTAQAVAREMKEELNVEIENILPVHFCDDPDRDPRGHVVSVVYVATTKQKPIAGSDAKNAILVDLKNEPLPEMVFDHSEIIKKVLNLDKFFKNDLSKHYDQK